MLFTLGGIPIHLWRPDPRHGDYCTDAAFVCAKVCGGEPLEWAKRLVRAMKDDF